MLLNPSLISHFDASKDALLLGLQRSCNYAAMRDIVLDVAHDDAPDHGALIRAVEHTQRSLQALQADLVEAQNMLHKLRARTLTALSSSIATLPVELLSDILGWAIRGPGRHRTITSLASVCETWRVVVLDMKWAFVQADWDRWPAWLLEDWCSRARGSPLVVKLGVSGVARLLNSPSSPYIRAFDSHKATWETLEVYTTTHQLQSDLFTRLLMNEEINSVRRLILTVCRSTPVQNTIRIPNEASFPNLRELHLNGTFLTPTTSFADVQNISLTLSPESPWSQWTSTLASASRLASLSLQGTTLRNIEGASRLELPNLVALRLLEWHSTEVILVALEHVSLPNLRQLVIQHTSNPVFLEDGGRFIHNIARTAPQLRSLTFSECTNKTLAPVLMQLRALTEPQGRSCLPDLREIHLCRTFNPPGDNNKLLLGPQYRETLEAVSRMPSIRKLRIPSHFVSPDCKEALCGRVGELQISDSPIDFPGDV